MKAKVSDVQGAIRPAPEESSSMGKRLHTSDAMLHLRREGIPYGMALGYVQRSSTGNTRLQGLFFRLV
jgi:hypothetical protein